MKKIDIKYILNLWEGAGAGGILGCNSSMDSGAPTGAALAAYWATRTKR